MTIAILESTPITNMGVGGATLERGIVRRGRKEMRAFIKKSSYMEEVLGARKLQSYIPVLYPLLALPNHAIFPDLSREGSINLHQAVERRDPSRIDDLISSYLSMHMHMWISTFSDQTRSKEIIGYHTKTADTARIFGQHVAQVAEMGDADIKQIDAGVKTGMSLVNGAVNKGAALTHGDEGLGNAIVRNSYMGTDRIVMIDNGSAGWRTPYEPIAKIVGWTHVGEAEAILDNRSPANWIHTREVVSHILTKSGEFGLDDCEGEQVLDAHLLVYLMREYALWSEPRNGGRSKELLAPVIASLCQKLTN